MTYPEAIEILAENRYLFFEHDGKPIIYLIEGVRRYSNSHTFLNDELVLYFTSVDKGDEILLKWSDFTKYVGKK